MRYDADKAPEPDQWLELDEHDRIDLVVAYHRRGNLPVGERAKAHAATRVIVENQVAMGDATVVPATLDRLMREGLDRERSSSRSFSMSPLARMITMPTSIPNMAASSAG